MHNFWDIADEHEKMLDTIMFFKVSTAAAVAHEIAQPMNYCMFTTAELPYGGAGVICQIFFALRIAHWHLREILFHDCQFIIIHCPCILQVS